MSGSQGGEGRGSLEAWNPEIFDDLDAWSPEYLITVKSGAANEMLWSPRAPLYSSFPGALELRIF